MRIDNQIKEHNIILRISISFIFKIWASLINLSGHYKIILILPLEEIKIIPISMTDEAVSQMVRYLT